jgi:hypothetical protein
MSASAWSALADRFAALATEQEFEFNTYPIGNPGGTGGSPHTRPRFIDLFGGTPDAPTNTGVVIGSGPGQPGEFARLNKLRAAVREEVGQIVAVFKG